MTFGFWAYDQITYPTVLDGRLVYSSDADAAVTALNVAIYLVCFALGFVSNRLYPSRLGNALFDGLLVGALGNLPWFVSSLAQVQRLAAPAEGASISWYGGYFWTSFAVGLLGWPTHIAFLTGLAAFLSSLPLKSRRLRGAAVDGDQGSR